MNNKKLKILLPVGIFIIAAAQVLHSLINLSDLLYGVSLGVGMGVTIIYFLSLRTAKPKS